MSDGLREWEMQIPEIATAYEVSVPLKGKPSTGLTVDMATLTAADREILAERRAEEGGGGDDDAAPPGDVGGAAAAPGASPAKGGVKTAAATAVKTAQKKTPSYLYTLARVKELYRTRNYEVALIELVELERHYPNDERVLSMKGTLHLKLGNRSLAREAWNTVLELNPYNLAVLEALQRLDKRGE
jgi:tetratricopeptide (TPR) repeat protein